MADMILKISEKDAVEEMNVFLRSLTEDQRRDFFINLEGVKFGLQLAAKQGAGGRGVQDTA